MSWSPNHGPARRQDQGVFSMGFIPMGAVVFQDGGQVVTGYDDIPDEIRGYGMVLDKDICLIPRDYGKFLRS